MRSKLIYWSGCDWCITIWQVGHVLFSSRCFTKQLLQTETQHKQNSIRMSPASLTYCRNLWLVSLWCHIPEDRNFKFVYSCWLYTTQISHPSLCNMTMLEKYYVILNINTNVRDNFTVNYVNTLCTKNCHHIVNTLPNEEKHAYGRCYAPIHCTTLHSLPYSQQPTTRLCSEAHESSLQLPTALKIHLNIIWIFINSRWMKRTNNNQEI